jgi:hypothetical protein
MRILSIACSVFLIFFSGVAAARDSVADERLVRDSGIATDPAGLMTFVRNLRPAKEQRARAEVLIRQLGADEFSEREKASEALVKLGPAVLPLVRMAIQSTDAEVRKRAKRCAGLLEPQVNRAVVAAAVRLLDAARPDGCALALLDLFAALRVEESAPEESLDYLTGPTPQALTD